MKNKIQLGGQFKFDVYDVSGNHLRSSDYIDNFITNSGVLYPYYFAFADCFRYLSLGTGTGKNSTGIIGNAATTGLQSGIGNFAYLGSGNYVTGGFLGGGCGNFADPNSNVVSLIRQWGIPSTSPSGLDKDYNFSEIMVSPGRPYVTGWSAPDGSAVETGVCLCSDTQIYSINNGSLSSPDLTGLDCSQIAKYYGSLSGIGELTLNQDDTVGGLRPRISMCDAPYAFSRITGNFYAKSGEILTITYKLNLSFGTGIKSQSFSPSTYDSVDNNWKTINSVSNITNPGIKLIVDGYIKQLNPSILSPNGNNRFQQLDFVGGYSVGLTLQEYGESFIPSLGIPFEPSCIYGQSGNFVAYISDDNTQFLVSKSGGACNTGIYKPWNTTGKSLPQNSGLMPFSQNINGNIVTGAIYNGWDGQYWQRNPFNIRQGNGLSSVGYPSGSDVSSPNSLVNPNTFTGGYSNSLLLINSRTGVIQTKYQFTKFELVGPDHQYTKSLVLGYVDASIFSQSPFSISNMDSVNAAPFFDCLFSGTSFSSYFIPVISTGGQNNSPPTTFTGEDDVNYNYFTGIPGALYPTFTNQLSWTADCPSGVDGC